MTKYDLSLKVQDALSKYDAVFASIADKCLEGGRLNDAILEEVFEDDARTDLDYTFTADAVYRYIQDLGEVELRADDVYSFEMDVKRHERVLDISDDDAPMECLVLKVLYKLINSDIFDDLNVDALEDLWEVRCRACRELTLDADAIDVEHWLETYYTK